MVGADMELGGLLMAMRMKGETLDELLGFYQAVDKRVYKLTPRRAARVRW